MPRRSALPAEDGSTAETPEPSLVWTRPATTRRAALTREAIVAAAIRVADAEGLAAVSVRRLAIELDARPMSIYSYARIESKEELFDLMVDEVCAEMLVPDLPDPWRPALRAVATRTRAALLAHPWWVELIGRNVLLGPHGTRYQEQLLAAVRTLDADPKTKQAVGVTVETYVVGQITFALDEQGSAETEHRSTTRSRQAVSQYQRDLIATGEFPQLSSVGPPEPSSAADRDRYFNLGLDWLLAGIGASLEPDAGPHRAD
ncbi:TetR/AcrR family transcriptional regulator C-terminal domain-containing protein [Rugosimonospora africana]|uniref:TetR family transcriptional regulator n=1 Tax=Rugosimonospora africana TaxID=556532 RepID=A0A8J3VN75_9ACTN|nr:TetR/AcrR family transcriptional regulator C-terminal domain-containing protein [Rugosimonospora africana]GIH11908.1 TetR family transcriptional regulator [Rugosimonospora africana]